MNPIPEIADPDVQLLADLATTLAPDYTRDLKAWEGSPFKWILSIPSRSKGAAGEALIAQWAAAKGFDVLRSPDSDADRVVEGHRIEIKLSTLWKTGKFAFQQIRDQNYDYCFCLGVSPFDVQAWLLPKALLHTYVIGHMPQHTGAKGTETFWLQFKPNDPYPWMSEHGGRLSDVERLLKAAGRGPHRGRQ